MALLVTLLAAAAAAFINIWLAARIVQRRIGGKVMHGDGGDPLLMKRMRAQANFTEYAPFVLILIALVELARGSSPALAILALMFVLARIAHPLGMDHDGPSPLLRGGGAMLTWLVMAVLAGWALVIVYQVGSQPLPAAVPVPVSRG